MKKKIIKWSLIIGISGLIVAVGTGFYMFNMPHRDVQAASVDFKLPADELVQEYLVDPSAANEKYLDSEGESKILAVTGTIAAIDYDMKEQQVILLKSPESKAGVSCTMSDTDPRSRSKMKIGDEVSVKGVIRSGAGYDEDLDMYEDVILEKCDIVEF